MRCPGCSGVGVVDKVIFTGQKLCPQCGGSGCKPEVDASYKRFREEYRDMADYWMDQQEKDWAPDYEGGGWVPADAAAEWSSPDGAWRDWDGWQL